jgi:hypothetical protein
MPPTNRPAPAVPAAQPAPPVLPTAWTAQMLLTPFGDAAAPMQNYQQLVVANVSYSAKIGMLVEMYLTQDLRYVCWIFASDGWYWVDRTPGGPINNLYGPFYTPLQTPVPDFLSAQVTFGVDPQLAYTYPVMGQNCDHWVMPTDSVHGIWFSFKSGTNIPYRIFSMDSGNPELIPILGSYYMVNVPTFTVDRPDDDGPLARVHAAVQAGKATAGVSYPNTLVTQQDVQAALANPLASAPITVAQIQALIPGFTPMPSNVPIPQWTNQTYIEGWTLGTDFIPYQTTVWYWYQGDGQMSKQRTEFVGLGLTPGGGSFTQRQDCCLFDDNSQTPPKLWTDVPQYYQENNQWVASCCAGTIPGVGVPIPNWLQAAGGQCYAQIAGNANFGLQPGQVLNLFSAPLERGWSETALFWVWFTGAGAGVVFTEGNFLKPMDHNLQLIDYTYFEQNATWITDSYFPDPCPSLSACTIPQTVSPRPAAIPRKIFGPVQREGAMPSYAPPKAGVPAR